ncbi:NarK/NasA family nitrate transporter [Nocardiopsis sp. EMB25]|uniref:MFS transporter n=1 Tax=Nocardiopsis sp. EMB25 TaxID=2835867 RepID=UPI00228356F9|nr:nitrate/nitrite transporter [Nocardiopsis sp. EMB25]MCY9784487.1 NarK/NasA family nitrate transporter [Nocardiopsis sp. EMB25]
MNREVRDRRPRWIDRWDPEDSAFWERTGLSVASRNLWSSIFTEHLGFCVWSLWSVLVLFMTPQAGFSLTAEQKFLLLSAVALSGAVLRVPYTLATGLVGGRTWTVVSVSLLVVPTVVAAVLVSRPETPYPVLLALAATAGLGGGNFSSSMANINHFWPEHHKGLALGLNAGGGNIGVATVQFLGLAVLAVLGVHAGRSLPLLFLPLLLLGVWVAWRFMDNLAPARARVRDQVRALRERHFWILSLLYVGTFGSFIGFGFAFGVLLQSEFGREPLEAASIAFLGPAVGSLVRPLGGWLADRLGGARVTILAFLGMALAGVLVVPTLAWSDVGLFTAVFAVLFALTGLCNGSTYKMIPAVYAARAQDLMAAGRSPERARAETNRTSATLLGLIGAVGALGGVAVNLALRESFGRMDSAVPAFVLFCAFYLLCAAVTWVTYRRRPGGRLDRGRRHAQVGADSIGRSYSGSKAYRG